MQQDKRNTLPNRGNQFLRADNKSTDTLDLREFWKTLVRQKRLIGLIVGSILLLTLLFTLASKNIYRATSTLQIERQDSTKIIDSNFLTSGDIRDTRDFYQTQFELIRARSLAARVIEELKLDESLSSASLLGHIKQWFSSGDPRSKQTALENRLLDNLSIEPVKNSQLVAVHYDSSDPEQAAKIANKVVETFLNMNMERRIATTSGSRDYLAQKIEAARKKLEESQDKLTEYANKNEVFQINSSGTTPTAFELKEYSEELLQIRRQRRDIENTRTALQKDVQTSFSERVSQLTNNPGRLIQMAKELDEQKAALEKSPSSAKEKAFNQATTKFETELAARIKQLDIELSALKKKEASVRENVVRAEADAMLEHDKDIEYRTLQKEVATNQDIYQDLMKRYNEVSVAGDIPTSNITIIDPAQAPINKFKPSLPTNLAFGALLGLFLGISAAFLREFMDDRVKDVTELERATQLPVLGVVPAVSEKTAEQMAVLTIKEPRSGVAEAFRSLRTALRFVLDEGNKGVIFVTSAHAGEGKSTTTSNLACAYANAGHKVLLIDADLRNPSLHKTLGISNETGLSNYLEGYGNTDSLVQGTTVNNLSLIPAGSLPDDPAELLASAQMESLLTTARDAYDLIILDGPPVLGLADAIILASLADATLLTVRAESTRMGTLSNALKRLNQSHANLSGILLNQVDMRRGSRFGYDYADYYYYQKNV